eukprot:scaffold4.g4833.t1
MDAAARLFRVRRTCIEMLGDRGYVVPDEDRLATLEGFKERFGEEPRRDDLLLLVERQARPPAERHPDDPTIQTFVFFPDEVKVGVKTIKALAERMRSDSVSKAILVVQGNMTPFAKQCLQEMQPKYQLELFLEQVKDTQLPRIQHSDPVARYYGMQRGQVVRIVRASETAGRYVTYRLCPKFCWDAVELAIGRCRLSIERPAHRSSRRGSSAKMTEQQEAMAASRPDGQEAAAPVVVGLGAGSAHSLALLSMPRGSVVVAFGRGEDGQLGVGDAEERLTPAAVHALVERGITSVHCGWGDFGRLGQEGVDDVFIPAPIPGLSGKLVAAVACGDTHTLVATAEGEVYSFGRNISGQASAAAPGSRGGRGGRARGCLAGGGARCGSSRRQCRAQQPSSARRARPCARLALQLGLGHAADSLAPQLVEALSGKRVVGVAAGAEHSVCCTDEGEVYAWGWGTYYCIGDGDVQNRLSPVRVAGLHGINVRRVACGWRHSAAIDDRGRLATWGWGKYSQLGHGDLADQPLPKLVEALAGTRMAIVAGGWRHTLAADEQGRLWAWGWNRFGQLGLGTHEDTATPQLVPLPEGEQVASCVCGWKHNLVATRSGRVFSWGRGGPLGLGDTADVSSPREVAALSKGSIDLDGLLQGAAAAAAHAIPASERYAVVPDQKNGSGAHAVPEAKRQRT